MALNPLAYTEKIVQSFLRYQLTTYPFADPRLHAQMRDLLSLETARETPLLKGPFVSLSRAFRAGARIESLVDEGLLHPHMQQIIPFASVYGHQEEGIRAICGGRTTLISTGTGSGKSECFLYPIISRCLELRDQQAPAGICAVIVYPMNALAEDQLGRLRELLAGRGIPFGMYVGKTPNDEAEVTGERLPAGASNADYLAAIRRAREQGEGISVHPPEEVCSRQIMRTRGRQPRILLTNVKQLELLLTRQSDVELFDQARLDFLVFDEAHTFTGAQGSETACLVRRLRSFCGRDAGQTVCVATSATIVDQDHLDAARDFASRFFGVDRDQVATVREVYEEEVWAAARTVPAPPDDPMARLRDVLTAVDAPDPEVAVRDAWNPLTGEDLPPGDWETALHEALSASELLYQAAQLLEKPRALADLLDELGAAIGRPVGEEELILWLTLGAAAWQQGRPLLRPVVHGFLRGVSGAVVTFEGTGNTPVLHLSAEEEDDPQDQLRLRVSTCTTCGQHYFVHALAGFEYTGRAPGGGAAQGDGVCWEALDPERGGTRVLLLDRLISAEEGEGDDDHPRLSPLFLCRRCGAAHPAAGDRCLACGQAGTFVVLQVVQQREDRPGLLLTCLCCGAHGRRVAGRFREPIKPVRATNVADVHILAQDMIHHAERRRLLVFADNRQDAAFQAGWMRDHARRFRLRSLIAQELEARPLSLGDLTHYLDTSLEKDDALSMALLPEVWAVAPKEAGGVVHREERRYLLRILLLREITMSPKQQIGLEPWALDQMAQLEQLRRRIGALDEEQQSFYDRCRRLVRRLKGTDRRQRRQAQGVDDIATYNVLAAEGFLPGYGLDTGAILGMAEVPRWVRGMDDFDLPRPPGIALREYMPGNRIYANSQEFVPKRYALDIGEGRREAIVFEVNADRQAVHESRARATGDPSSALVTSIPICDVTLVHASRITDEEETRFQMGVAVYGRELDQHSGGQAYRWGPRDLQLRKGVRLQLVNVGPNPVIQARGEFGYPVCRVCGQSVSPFSSHRQREDFAEKHQEWCGQVPEATAFHADLSVDALSLPACSSKEEAYSLTEALRFAAAEVLDMELEDLQVLVIGRTDSDDVDALLYDPMPGGSGLLPQLCDRSEEIVAEARRLAGDCPSECAHSCIDCFQHYRNAFYHEYLNRHLVLERLEAWGARWEKTHPIPPKLPAQEPSGDGQPVNVAERKLRRMLLAAGLPEDRWQEQRLLSRPLNSTTPDVTYDDPDDDERKIFIYLDGLSAHLHGNPETRERDNQIRSELRSEGHEVIEITAADLDDEQAMTRHLKRLARSLIGRDMANRVGDEAAEWFAAREESEPAEVPDEEEPQGVVLPFRWIEEPAADEPFRTCVPIYSLKAAAGSFSEGQIPEPDGWAVFDSHRPFNEEMFVAQVVGKSMEPRIPDGSWCLFSRQVAGSRHGRILVVQHRGIADPETGGSYTVKRYERLPQDAENGQVLLGKVLLKPLNPGFEPIVIDAGDEDIAVMAELLEVIRL